MTIPENIATCYVDGSWKAYASAEDGWMYEGHGETELCAAKDAQGKLRSQDRGDATSRRWLDGCRGEAS